MPGPLNDVKIKIGKSEVSLGALAGGNVLSVNDATVISQRPNKTTRIQTVFDQNVEESRSKTIQSEKSETDINMIVARAIKGNLIMTNQREPRYGDFSSGYDFLENSLRIKAFETEFERLPSEIRAKFDNDASKLIDFASDPDNEDEAIKLGILPKKVVPPVVNPEAPVVPPVVPPVTP